jgi:hypothetical protein
MGQSKSKERDFKEQKRSKVLKKDFRSKALKNTEVRVIEKGSNDAAVSPSESPAHLDPALCMFVYRLSFLHLPSPPVRFRRNRSL